jgi:hypothetical protein
MNSSPCNIGVFNVRNPYNIRNKVLQKIDLINVPYRIAIHIYCQFYMTEGSCNIGKMNEKRSLNGK